MSRRSKETSKRSLSTREEDNRASKRHHKSHSHKNEKRKSSERRHHRSRISPRREETKSSSACKDDSHRSRHIKKASYKLQKTQETEQRVKNKHDPEKKHSSRRVHKDNVSSCKEQKFSSRKDDTANEIKITGKKTLEMQNKATVPEKAKDKSKDKREEKCSRKSESVLKTDPPSASSASIKQDDGIVRRKRSRSEALSSAGSHSSPVRTKLTASSPIRDVSVETLKKIMKRSSQKKEEIESRPCVSPSSPSSSFKPAYTESSPVESNRDTGAVPSVTTTSSEPVKTQCQVKEEQQTSTKESFSSLFNSTHAESDSKSNKATLAVHTTRTKSHKADQPSATLKKTNAVIIGPHISFKIAKKVLPRTFRIPLKKKTDDSAKVNQKLSEPTTTQRISEHQDTSKAADTSEHTHGRLEVTPQCSPAVPHQKSTRPLRPQDTFVDHNALASNQVQELCPVPLPGSFTAAPVADEGPPQSYTQSQVVEELFLARSEKRLEVNVTEIYGELTCMEIDPPEETLANAQSPTSAKKHLIIVLDTNILLSHLDYVKTITSRGLGCLGFPVILIPWVVLQELDSLKQGKGLSGSVAHLAIPAISYIYNCIRKKDPHLWGQSMQQASESSYGLKTENNDDRVLQCCLQYLSLYPESIVILCTNDKNLCCKAVLSGVKASNKNDLEAEIRAQHLTPSLPHTEALTPTQRPHANKTPLSVKQEDKDVHLLQKESEESSKWELSRCVLELEKCLHTVLSDILEVEMEAVYKEIWVEIVLIKPPWTLLDVLRCLKKHWIAVFGNIVPRQLQETIINLIDFFLPGKTADHSRACEILQLSKELLHGFLQRSNRVPHAISVIDGIYNQLHPQSHRPSYGESSAEDIVMNDADEEDRPHQVSHQHVWATFESLWNSIFNTSMEVFKALRFDPQTKQSAQPVGSQWPPQDALACLHKLSSTASQLLQAFGSVLSMAPDVKEIEALLCFIYSTKIADENSRVTVGDLLECFAQPDYREKLQCGVGQLMELHQVLTRCIQVSVANFAS